MPRPGPKRGTSRARAVLRPGARLGKYRLGRRLGRGAFAEVWQARDTVENRKVALKVAFPEVIEQWGRNAVEREARIASRLDHPHVVGVRNADWIDGRFVLASDLARTSLASYAGSRRSASVALRVIREVASGLAYAHGARLMHRDVKPENILIFEDGRAALADFGVSRFARGTQHTLSEAGTIGYMAPEQAYGRPRLSSDVFSLGLIAYELLTGFILRWPFTWPPEGYARFRAKVPEPVRKVLERAAEFDPDRRFPDGEALHVALERAFHQVALKGPSRAPRRRPRPELRSPLEVQAEVFRRHFGSVLELRYLCHRCDGPVAESMAVCPWCGTRENSFQEITSYPFVCPECERGVRPEWRACPWCFRGRFESNGRRPSQDRRATRSCSSRGCAGQLRPFMHYCPLCKRKTRRPWTVPELPHRCPRCRWPVSREFWRFCPWCGRRETQTGGFRGVRT
ncbi:MAG: serine/threonine-protein kinase [Myxococcota bacterium]